MTSINTMSQFHVLHWVENKLRKRDDFLNVEQENNVKPGDPLVGNQWHRFAWSFSVQWYHLYIYIYFLHIYIYKSTVFTTVDIYIFEQLRYCYYKLNCTAWFITSHRIMVLKWEYPQLHIYIHLFLSFHLIWIKSPVISSEFCLCFNVVFSFNTLHLFCYLITSLPSWLKLH